MITPEQEKPEERSLTSDEVEMPESEEDFLSRVGGPSETDNDSDITIPEEPEPISNFNPDHEPGDQADYEGF
jgi:hypothetical protein